MSNPSAHLLPWPLLRLAFRPFFLFGAVFSALSVVVWAAVFSGYLSIDFFGGSYWWHIHEMLFGFVAAIVVGFLLTAVQTWTAVPSIKGASLGFLLSVWLLARMLMLLPSLVPAWLISLIDLSFLPLAAFFLARPIIKVRLWRNIMFIPLLLILTYLNASMHCSVYIASNAHLLQASYATVLIITVLMCLMGGRVFPMFTASGTNTQKVLPIAWLEKLSLASIAIAAFINFGLFEIAQVLNAGILFATAAIHATRALRWRIWVTLKTPLAWSLHLSYWCIPLGLVILGLAKVGLYFSPSQAIHTLTIGAIGLMILSMTSRVSLGHTGRPIIVGRSISLAFSAVLFAFVLRVFGPFWTDQYTLVILLAAFFWGLAFSIFVLKYAPILSRARVDGKDG